MAELQPQQSTGWRARMPSITQPAITDSGRTALKGIAVIAMSADHLNKYVFAGALPWCFEVGRLAMPLFALVLGWNLARPGAEMSGAQARTGRRLLLTGLIAQLPFWAIGGTALWGWPLNVLFTLWIGCQVVRSLEQNSARYRVVAAALFIIGGACVEFWWPAVALVVGSWLWARGRPITALAALITGFAGLHLINGNGWALLSLPLAVMVARWRIPIPRLRRFFYAFYPAHLVVLWALQGKP